MNGFDALSEYFRNPSLLGLIVIILLIPGLLGYIFKEKLNIKQIWALIISSTLFNIGVLVGIAYFNTKDIVQKEVNFEPKEDEVLIYVRSEQLDMQISDASVTINGNTKKTDCNGNAIFNLGKVSKFDYKITRPHFNPISDSMPNDRQKYTFDLKQKKDE